MNIKVKSLELSSEYDKVIKFTNKELDLIFGKMNDDFSNINNYYKDIGFLYFSNNTQNKIINITSTGMKAEYSDLENFSKDANEMLSYFKYMNGIYKQKELNIKYYLDVEFLVQLTETQFNNFVNKLNSFSTIIDFKAFSEEKSHTLLWASYVYVNENPFVIALHPHSVKDKNYVSIKLRPICENDLEGIEKIIGKNNEIVDSINNFIKGNFIE